MILKSAVDYLIVGLGNPGTEYELTRHNVGFRALDYISGEMGAEVRQLKHRALVGKIKFEEKTVLLMKPQTYMNNSGEAVADATHFYKIPADHVIVLVDDVSIPVGALRLRYEGSAGGHNGLKSIEQNLGTNQYIRIRFGVGAKANAEMDLADHVLGKIPSSEYQKISENYPFAMEAISLIMKGEKERATSKCNRNPAKEEKI